MPVEVSTITNQISAPIFIAAITVFDRTGPLSGLRRSKLHLLSFALAPLVLNAEQPQVTMLAPFNLLPRRPTNALTKTNRITTAPRPNPPNRPPSHSFSSSTFSFGLNKPFPSLAAIFVFVLGFRTVTTLGALFSSLPSSVPPIELQTDVRIDHEQWRYTTKSHLYNRWRQLATWLIIVEEWGIRQPDMVKFVSEVRRAGDKVYTVNGVECALRR